MERTILLLGKYKNVSGYLTEIGISNPRVAVLISLNIRVEVLRVEVLISLCNKIYYTVFPFLDGVFPKDNLLNYLEISCHCAMGHPLKASSKINILLSFLHFLILWDCRFQTVSLQTECWVLNNTRAWRQYYIIKYLWWTDWIKPEFAVVHYWMILTKGSFFRLFGNTQLSMIPMTDYFLIHNLFAFTCIY